MLAPFIFIAILVLALLCAIRERQLRHNASRKRADAVRRSSLNMPLHAGDNARD